MWSATLRQWKNFTLDWSWREFKWAYWIQDWSQVSYVNSCAMSMTKTKTPSACLAVDWSPVNCHADISLTFTIDRAGVARNATGNLDTSKTNSKQSCWRQAKRTLNWSPIHHRAHGNNTIDLHTHNYWSMLAARYAKHYTLNSRGIKRHHTLDWSPLHRRSVAGHWQ